ncbi:hypothetical protein RAS2_04530 [Phycisphaerae bacterium RAS2]|nr:hypothetical protein RAS2_04530 [Phycisphaerae bacterium RAS2]
MAMQKSGARKRSSIPVWLLGMCIVVWGLTTILHYCHATYPDEGIFQIGVCCGFIYVSEWRCEADPTRFHALQQKLLHAPGTQSLRNTQLGLKRHSD